ncbi:DUF2922 family protein [Lactiplantibacillus plantarum]|nr:DUF2922 family protein [Lactiplantibacillus plantarum]
MKTLDLSFKTSTNKVHHLKLHYANDNLSKDVVSKNVFGYFDIRFDFS